MDESDAPPTGARARRGWPWEGLALLVVLALVFAKLAAVSADSWRAVFLANGDSLVLPLFLQSLQRGEPLDWIFSSQTFFFPEFPLYALCGILAGSAQGGLVLNALVNVVLLYLGFRAVTAAYAPGRRLRQVTVSLSAVVLFLAAMLTESGVRILGAGTIEPARITTVFLMTTYYGGAILTALGMLALVFWVSNRFRGGASRRRRVLAYGVLAVVVSGAVTYSNPLYLLWFVAPLGVAVLALLIAQRLTLRWALIVIFPQIVGLGLGMLARVVFARYIGANLDHYLATYGASQAAQLLGSVVIGWLRSPASILQLLILVVPIGLVAGFLIGRIRHRSAGDPLRATSAELFLAFFILASVVSLLAVQIGSGQSVTRYLLPLFVFPPLGFLLLRTGRVAARVRSLTRRARTAAAVAATAAALLTVGLSAPAVADLASPRSPVDSACLADWLSTQPNGGRGVNGVGSFWTVRALALYGTQKGRLLQVALPLSIQTWMNNIALYEGTTFSYALVDDVITGTDLRATLGAPISKIRCDGFTIYDYRGTHGETVLNRDIRTASRTLTRERS